ncbi:ABC transporter permease [Pseudonocardia kunmingensis]|uniref:Peptide/nickel transport system permease protein n=1 Tax=Pseudonocardia kunmingensis TaxID=630975 RepID=A0A543CYM4_9PSEU|nr:ABC transporter permease [Pseudonocardia kunmingensis]TQM02185.1 peptide/nickel transport system permease protein [Pseudonocardia kunmingensis]
MARFLVRRLVNYVVLLLVATFLTFSLASLTFNPLAPLTERNPPVPAEVIEAKRAELRLDEPIPQRFALWMADAVRGDFGTTVTGTPIADQLVSRAGVSLRLFLVGTVLGVVIGVVVGVAGAVRQYRLGDYAATIFSFVILSIPVFVLAQLLKFGGLQLNEAAGTTVLYFQGEVTPSFQGSAMAELVDRLQHLVLPTLAIALSQIALYSRYQRNAMLDVLGSDFLRTAQAKGLTRRRALFKHGLRTALIPMATLFAFGFGLLITGGVFTERIFGWFGMGDWFVYGVQQNDTNIVATVTLFVAVLILVSGWLSDLLYAALDPRVRIG